MTGNTFAHHAHEDAAGREYFHHSSGQRINTNAVLVEALRKQYPGFDLIIAPLGSLNLIAYASAGHAVATPLEDSVNDPVYSTALKWRRYAPPPRRLDDQPGVMVENVQFGKYLYKWNHQEIILYVANCRDGSSSYPDLTYHYIITRDTHKADDLIKEATVWGTQLHDEVWVFDQGFWQKSRELWESVQKSNWENVILEEGMKKAIIADVDNFFDNRDTYTKLKVPWKRGIIYYGPPGNGKTISIKAMMHALYKRGQSESDKRMTVPTLYVRSLSSFAGPEYSLRMIFLKARETAPCYLVFEDLDSIVNDSVRSYFLNEVDGLKSNDGILMVGSTNHLDRLDPGISKRPSRFDRKYYFPDPNFEQRVAYAKFWQDKLKDNEDLDFPDELCSAVAKITDKFSFAYMQEAFVASLLAIAVRGDKEDNSQASQYSGPEDPMTAATCRARFYCSLNKSEDSDAGLDKLVLWKEIQVQVKILKEEMDEKSGENSIPKELNSSKPYPECKMVMTETHGGHASSAPAEPKKESNYQSSESSTAEPSLFSSFEQWKETNSSRLSNPPIWSRPAPEPKWVQPKRMLESSIGMTPQYTARMVLDDVERVRGEMLRYQASRPAVVPSITADGIPSAFPHQVNTQSWPVARGGLPPPGSVSGAPNAPQYQPMDWTVQPEHRAYPDNLPPRSTIDQRETHTLMMGNPFSAPPLDTDQERKMWVQKDREDFEKKMEDIRAKIARIE